MEEGWRETWETMTGYAKTYWDQIAEILSSYETFVEFMKDSTEYMTASDVGKQILELGWEVLYEQWKSSGLISDEAQNYETDDHPWTEGTSNTTIADILGDAASDWLNLGLEQPAEAANMVVVDDYSDIGLTARPHTIDLSDLITNDTYTGLGITEAEEESAKEGGVSASKPIIANDPSLEGDIPSVDLPSLNRSDYIPSFDYDYSDVGVQYETKAPSEYAKVYSESPKDYTPTTSSSSSGSSSSSSSSSNTSGSGKQWHATVSAEDPTGGYKKSAAGSGATKDAAASAARSKLPLNNYRWVETGVTYQYYKRGGLVDYTGPAWVDGTPSDPEAFLSSIDTKMISSLIDALNYIRIEPSALPGESMFGNNTNVGDINITINQAELKSDADYEDVARRVGKAFTKELSRNGFNLTGYNL